MDLPQAALFLEKAPDQQQSAAQNAFAALFWDGKGVSKDLARAVQYFNLAANQGVADAQYRYAMWLLSFPSDHRAIYGRHSIQ
jgi:TPR repeat protein